MRFREFYILGRTNGLVKTGIRLAYNCIHQRIEAEINSGGFQNAKDNQGQGVPCLLYTSDAADE